MSAAFIPDGGGEPARASRQPSISPATAGRGSRWRFL
jgi:hypothetical protein